MIGYYTDNGVSKAVMRAFAAGGVKTEHIDNFHTYDSDTTEHIFYGILRGTGRAILVCQSQGTNFTYLDNGYFDAVYMDEHRRKEMSGTYRVVKNAMIEPISIDPTATAKGKMRVLIIPPSPYTAFMHDTTPEDWLNTWANKCREYGHETSLGIKEAGISLSDQFEEYDAVFAFNSLSVMKAIEMGKAVYTTHGVIQNSHMLGRLYAPYYDFDKIKKFYEPKQFTLEEIADRGVACLN